MDLVERLRDLKSVWGLLSGASVLFPGAAYVLNIGEIKTSQLSSLYPATAVPFGALALLLVILVFPEESYSPELLLSTYSQRRWLSTLLPLAIAVFLSLVGLIGFVYAAKTRNERIIERVDGPICYRYFEGQRMGDGYIKEIHHYQGRLTEVRKPCERHEEPSSVRSVLPSFGPIIWTDEETKTYIGIDSIEYQALAFFDLCFIALTSSFTLIWLRLKERHF